MPCTNNVFDDVEGEGLVVPARTWSERIESALREIVEEYEVKSELVGWVLAYVDDLLMVTWRGDEDDFPGDKLQREIETRWKCGKSKTSAPGNPLENTGIEIREFKEEYHLSQMKYTKSLLAKSGVLKHAK